ncbi:hypothetical protein ACFXJ5_36730 [Streptomyces sp. NPDC059373]
MTVETVDYERLMKATWDLLYAAPDARQDTLIRLPYREASLLRAAMTGGFEQEVARRRGRISPDLSRAFPLAFRVHCGLGGPTPLTGFLNSPEWRDRDYEFARQFPAPGPLYAAFHAYALRTWPAGAPAWSLDALRLEAARLRVGPLRGGVDRGPENLRLAEGVWVAECSFDHARTTAQLDERCEHLPWSEAIHLVPPYPERQVELLRVGDDGETSQLLLKGPEIDAMEWLWEGSVPVPRGAEDTSVLRTAFRTGFVA